MHTELTGGLSSLLREAVLCWRERHGPGRGGRRQKRTFCTRQNRPKPKQTLNKGYTWPETARP